MSHDNVVIVAGAIHFQKNSMQDESYRYSQETPQRFNKPTKLAKKRHDLLHLAPLLVMGHGVGILPDRHLGENVPGTSLLDDLTNHGTGPVGTLAAEVKRGKGDVILVPQPFFFKIQPQFLHPATCITQDINNKPKINQTQFQVTF
ncbi:hypothetical protein DFH11DRAFT_557170 [Phellopilus nigrolimitatus]|nr:hypothetical protein DFH11DRAFT_557170 [Phellopilus nigrolimitatus]